VLNFNRLLVAGFSVLAIVTLVRLLIPFGVDETNSILPEVYAPDRRDAAEQYLVDILANNLWDEDRTPLEGASSGVEYASASSDEVRSQPGQTLASASMTLIGVSKADRFAVIEYAQAIDRFSPGAMLPDGSQLEEVLEYGVRVSKLGKSEHMYLFGKNQVE